MALGHIFSGLGFIGVFSEFIYACIIVSQKTKLSPDDFGLRIFLPMIISLTLFGVGTFMLLRESVLKGLDEGFYVYFIPFMSAGGIYISYIAILFSNLVIRWKGD
jgi:hypothetical protein